MIDRTRVKGSRYDILSEDQKELQKYIEKEQKKDEKQKVKDLKNRKVSIENVNLQENYDNQDPEGSNNIIVLTLADNITHNYFHYFDLYWDAGDCMSSVTLKMPKTDTENTKYWITYQGEVEIYTGNNVDKLMQSTTNENNTATNDVYWSLQGLSPIFRGEVGRIKEYQNVLEIHIDSIGKRFKQKIPDEFRQAYINNQNVRDAFQAICEFLGVKYICPPAQPKEEEQPESDGTENDVTNKVQQGAQAAANAISQATQQNEQEANSSENAANTSSDTSDTSQTNDSSNTDQNTLTDPNANQPEGPQNGYADISFDANGAIIHGSVAIETSPDMTETLIELDEHPLEKYLEDTTYVASDVKKFLEGEFFDTTHGNFLSYGSITIEPASASSSEMTGVGSVSGLSPDSSSENGEESNGESSSGSDGGSSTTSSSQAGVKGVWGKTTKGSVYLTKDAINKMSRDEASRRYQDGKKRNIYTAATMSKLLQRSFGIWLI